jgi:hypothetical protein
MLHGKVKLRIDVEVGSRDVLAKNRSGVPEKALLVHRRVLVGLGQYRNVDPEARSA